uniref:Lipase 3 n=1 Tax=Cacopsylla melanoneura TaxID=428564 RepID=A0A8D8QNB6_9HEMI
MAMFDTPASIDYILSKSNQDKVTYIGHSMGNTIFYVMTAMRPEYNAKILVQLSLGPVAYFFHTTSPVKLVAPFAAELTKPPELLYHGELLSRSPLLNEVLRIFCTLNTVGMIFCLNLVFFLLGKDADQIKYSLIPSIVGHAPAGVSTKTLVHYSQFINRPNTFRQFDYGPLQNVQHYNSSVPPDYNVSAITAKVAFFYGPNDPLANEKDVKLFYPRLPNPIGLFRVNFSTFTHIDFLWAKDARAILYNQLLDLIDSETRKND